MLVAMFRQILKKNLVADSDILSFLFHKLSAKLPVAFFFDEVFISPPTWTFFFPTASAAWW